jgi:hypothetical protein
MGVHCDNCYAHNEGFPCIKCGWQPGNAVGPSPFDTTPTAPNDECMTCQGRGYIWVTPARSSVREREQCSDCTGTPTAPVQDDDAERDLRIALWNALREQGIAQERCYPIINGTVKALAARLSPTPETGLVEALRRIADITDIEADFDGFEARQIALDALSNVSLSDG